MFFQNCYNYSCEVHCYRCSCVTLSRTSRVVQQHFPMAKEATAILLLQATSTQVNPKPFGSWFGVTPTPLPLSPGVRRA